MSGHPADYPVERLVVEPHSTKENVHGALFISTEGVSIYDGVMLRIGVLGEGSMAHTLRVGATAEYSSKRHGRFEVRVLTIDPYNARAHLLVAKLN
jgi:hypothetical protein